MITFSDLPKRFESCPLEEDVVFISSPDEIDKKLSHSYCQSKLILIAKAMFKWNDDHLNNKISSLSLYIEQYDRHVRIKLPCLGKCYKLTLSEAMKYLSEPSSLFDHLLEFTAIVIMIGLLIRYP